MNSECLGRECRTGVNYDWVKELEERRVEAEGKLASAALITAEAAHIAAEATRLMAEAFVQHERVVSDLSANIGRLLDMLQNQ
nr:unnamed protein product [Callosobruchus chinensis]